MKAMRLESNASCLTALQMFVLGSYVRLSSDTPASIVPTVTDTGGDTEPNRDAAIVPASVPSGNSTSGHGCVSYSCSSESTDSEIISSPASPIHPNSRSSMVPTKRHSDPATPTGG